MSTGYCASCCAVRELVTEDSLGRPCCEHCMTFAERTYLAGVTELLAAMPFDFGDLVEARTAGTLLDGTGTIDSIDITFQHGGTPVYPMFHVRIKEKAYDEAPDDGWYAEVCLSRVREKGRADA